MPGRPSRPRRGRWSRFAALSGVTALVAALLVGLPAAPADAVDRLFEVNSLSHQGDDVAIGDGVCATSAGLCTLRAALQESNALPVTDAVVIAPAADVDAATPGIQTSGTIVGSGSGAANMMFVGTLTPFGDGGAYFLATRAVTMDFQNRLGIASLNDGNGATAIYVNGPGVVVRNFSNIKSNETAIVVGPNGDGAVIENGSSIDPGSINLERFLWLADGADSVTVRRVEMGSTYAGGGGAIMVAQGAVINDLTLDRIRMYDPDTEAYYGLVTQTSFLNRLRVVGSTFEGFQATRHALDLRGTTFTDAVISGNTFTRMNITNGYTSIWVNRPGTNNVISQNTFRNDAATVAGNGVFFNGLALAATQNSGWRVQENSFDGMRSSSVSVGAGSGILPVERNIFGPLSYGGGLAANETSAVALVNNAATTANQGITTWFPTAATVDTATCELDVDVTPPVTAPIPAVPVHLDVYFTAATQAEIYLGGVSGLTTATTVSVPYTLGAGFIRVQTTAATGATSQYSRVVPQSVADACGPRVTLDQAAGQADPTSARDIRFTARFSESITDAPTPADVSTAGSTAPGVTVTAVTRLSASEFEVTARANGSGQVVLSLPAGAVADPAGNLSVASTSTDNSVTYVSPLTLAPTAVSVTEGGPVQGYTVTSTLAATSPLTITPTVVNAGWATAAPAPLTIATTQDSGTIQVAAVDDSVVNAARTTTITHTVSSADLNFDGLVLPDVAVQVIDNDQPDVTLSSLAVSAGTRVANGTDAHTATATVRNSGGQPVTGVLVTFQVPSGVTVPTGLSCVTAAAGTCSISLTSTVAGTDPIRAFVDSAEIGGSPASVAFVAGPWDPATTTIAASVASVPADGESTSTITVTLFDAFGNRVTSSAGPATWTGAGGGTLSGETDHGDGTYTVLLTAPITVGAAVVSAAIGGVSTNSVTINFVPGEASPGHAVISADPESITADGVSTSEVVVELRDAYDNVVSGTGDTVTMSTTAGTLSGVTPLGNGRYSATLTAPTTAGTATESFTVNGASAAATADIALLPGAPDPGQSQITAEPGAVTADGVSQSSVRVVLFDAVGNRITTGGATVEIATDLGTISAVRDDGDGSYVALLTAPTAPGTATLTAMVGGVPLTQTATVQFLAGAADPASSLIVAAPTTVVADGVATSTITVTIRDAQGTVLTEGGADVEIATDLGSLGPVSDNGDGTYTATLTAGTTVGTATVTFAVNGAASPSTATVVHLPGPADPTQSLIAADPPTVVADGTASATVTVTLEDAFGNPRPNGDDVVEIASDLGSLGSVLNNGDGTYTAFLASTTLGTATISYRVNGADGTSTASVVFIAGAADPTTSTIAASPTSIVADGDSTSTVTVQLLDAVGNPLTASGGTVVIATTTGTIGATTDNADGTYTATLTSATAVGTATLSFAVNGDPAANTATVAFVAGAADPTTSTIEAAPTTIAADGASTSTVTVRLIDANGHPLTSDGGLVVIATDAGSVSTTTSQGDGTYTATLTSATAAGTATVSFTLDGVTASATATVAFVAGAVDLTTSTISADPTVIVADGDSTSTVTVQLRDANGNPLTASGGTVVIATDAGAVGATTDHDDGTYSATLTSATAAGTATLSFTVDGDPAAGTATVAFVAGAADPTASTISADPASIVADGVSTSTVTVQLVDADGNPLTASGGTVVIATDVGAVGATTDHGDGTYSATLTSVTAAGTATVSFTIDAAAAADTAAVEFVAGAANPTTSAIAASPASIVADGASTSTVTVTLLDVNGNPLTASGGVVVIATDAGSIGATTDVGDGTYTATLTSATVAGTAALSFTLDGVAGAATATVEFVAGAANPTTSTIAASPASIAADGASTSTVTVTLLDVNGNPLTASGGVVVMATDAGSIGATTDVGDGTYTATLTSATVAGTAALSFTLGGVAGVATAVVAFVAGAADPGLSTIAASPASIVADGASTSTVTVTLLDVNGNPLTASGGVVVMATDAGSIGATTDVGDGTYTATLTSATVAGTAALSFTLGGVAGVATAVVAFVAGAADPGLSTIAASPTSIVADGASTSTVTVTLLDVNGNPLTASGGVVVIATDAGSIGTTTDVGDGTYTATLMSAATSGTATLSFTLDGVAGAATAAVEFVAGAANPTTSTIAASPTSIVADGASTSTVTVTLRDVNGNPLTASAGTVVIATDAGSIGATTDVGNGTYTATLTSAVTAGAAALSFTLDAVPAAATATVQFVADAADPTTSTIVASPTSIIADGASASTVTVTLLDVNGNPVGASGGTVVIATDAGSIGSTTDVGDGTYTATLTSATIAGTATLSFTLNDVAAVATATVTFVPGPVEAGSSTISADPAVIVADGAATSTVTVTLFDAQGNRVTTGGQVVTLSTTAGTLSAVTDVGDGTHTATLTAGTASATATVGFGVDGAPGTTTATVQFVAGAPSPTTSTITADPASVTADGVSTSTVAVTLRDANGNLVAAAGAIVTMSTTAGSLGAVTDHGDGTYSAVLTAPGVAGAATESFMVAGAASPNTAVVTFVPGTADLTTSTIGASPTVLVADGAAISTVTVQLVDALGNPLTASGGTVVVTSDAGSISATTDNNDGTYTAQLTAPTVVGTANVGFTVDGVTAADTVVVSFVPGASDPGTSQLEAVPPLLTADGVSTSTVRLTVLDSVGNPVGTGGGAVLMQTDAGTLSAVSDNGDGTYTAVLTAPTTTAVPVATITATLDGATVADTATVAFVAGEPSAQTSTIAASPSSIVADGASTSAITVTLLDGQGNPVTGAGDVVTVSTDLGVLGPVSDNGDGTYSATLTSGTTAGTATVGFAVDGSAGTEVATVVFTAGSVDPAGSSIVASPQSVVADGVSSSAITVTLFDANGNPLQVGGDAVTLSTDLGTLGPVTDLGNGSYTATLTSPTTLGQATVTFAVSGVGGSASATVDFVAGPPDPGTSTIVAVPTEIEAGSGASLITVTLLDAQGNPVAGSASVTITTTLGVLSAVTMPGNGTASAALTSTAVGTATDGFTINGATGLATVVVTVVDTIAPAAPVITAPSDGAKVRPDVQISGTGEPGATLVVASETGVVCTTVVGSDGRWSCFPIAPLPEATSTLTARQSDAVGNPSAASPTVTVTVDGTVPPPPVLDPTNGAQVTGTSEVGTTVTVRGPDGAVVCTAVTAADGTFACTPTADLPAGMLLSATATDEVGNESAPGLVRVGGARVTLDLMLAVGGQTQTALGLGFLPDEPVTGLMESTPVDLGRQIADAGGTATFTLVLPVDLEPGTHRITLTGPGSGAVWAEFEVALPTTPAVVTSNDAAPLPQSGAETGWLLRTAVLLVGIGGFLLGARRRITGPATRF